MLTLKHNGIASLSLSLSLSLLYGLTGVSYLFKEDILLVLAHRLAGGPRECKHPEDFPWLQLCGVRT